jgi:hypothetical protein
VLSKLPHADAFRPALTTGNNFAWLGSKIPFHKLTILLGSLETPVPAWAYKYTGNLSTLIVECTENTYRSRELCRKPPDYIEIEMNTLPRACMNWW